MVGINKRIFYIPLIACVFVLAVLISFTNIEPVYAVEKVSFEEEYAVPGEDLHVSVTGSEGQDLTYKWYIDNTQIEAYEAYYCPTEEDLEKFISVVVSNGNEVIGECDMFCSKLPVVYIDTKDTEIVKEDYIDANLRIQGNSKYNSQTTTLYNNVTEVKGHGNSTWKRFDKKAYRLKLDKSTNLFGMGKNKHWVLLANYIDESCMRNMLGTHFGKHLGTTAMDNVWVDVVLDGECIGNYQLYEHVRISEERVDIFDWEEAAGDIAEAIAENEGLSSDDEDALKDLLETNLTWITTKEVEYNGTTYTIAEYYELPESNNGGFLIEMDTHFDELSRFYTDREAPIMIKRPEYINTNSEAFASLQKYIQDFEDAIHSKDKNISDEQNNRISYVDMCDVDSMVSFWLASEFMYNEIGERSTFMQKDIDGKLVFGPIWDFDWSSNAVGPFGTISAERWATDDGFWFLDARQDPYFAIKVRELYLKNESMFRETISEGGTIDQWYDYIKESALKNESIWYYSRGFEEDLTAVKIWINKRTDWIDDQFATDDSAMRSLGTPISDKFSLSLSSENLIQNNKKAYSIPVDTDKEYRLQVDINDGAYSKLNYYVNGRHIDRIDIEGKDAAEVMIPQELLTEDLNEKNVISVWLEDGQGNLVEQQYCTIIINSVGAVYYNVVLDEYGASTAEKVVSGNNFRLPAPSIDTTNMLFMGWSDGEKLYSVAEDINITTDLTLTGMYATCVGEDVYHSWQDTDEGYICAECDKNKADDKSYIDIAICSFRHSTKYRTEYTGEPVAPRLTITYKDRKLVEGVDYRISHKNNVNLGYATSTVEGIKSAGFDGKTEISYRIIERDINDVKVSTSSSKYTYSGSYVKPAISVTYNGKTLVKDKDYTVAYENNKAIGIGKIVLTGKGNFTGTKMVMFEIVPKNTTLSSPVVDSSKQVTIKWKKQSVQTTGYQIAYSKSSKFTSYKTVTVSGADKTSKTFKFSSTWKKYYFKIRTYKTVDDVKYYSPWSDYIAVACPKDIKSAKMSVSTSKYTYSGLYKKPSVIVKYNGKKLTKGKDYTVSYKNNKYVGTGKVVVKGKGNYGGTKEVKFKIVPRSTTLLKPVSYSSKQVKVKWYKRTSQTSGYQIIYSKSSKFTNSKTITVKSAKTTSKTLKCSTANAKYYFKVRTYKTVNGAHYYSPWSKYRTVVTKR